MNRLLFLVRVAFVLNSCAPSSEGTRALSTRDVLTSDEIVTTDASTTYDAITLRRPNFLNSRGPKV